MTETHPLTLTVKATISGRELTDAELIEAQDVLNQFILSTGRECGGVEIINASSPFAEALKMNKGLAELEEKKRVVSQDSHSPT